MDKNFININGRLITLDTPLVMGILNVTPDSFFSESRISGEAAIRQRIDTIIEEGGTIIDLGGYSSRPDASSITEEEEWIRIEKALHILYAHYPDMPVSVDTFRAQIARRAVEQYGVSIINDISGGAIDATMFETVADLRVPYILMHMRGTPQTMQQYTTYEDFPEEIMLYFAEKVQRLRQLGIHDIILDPGLGFSKTLTQNYELMRLLPEFSTLFDCPLLVGVSRKSMIYKLLQSTPEDALNESTALHAYALFCGANILRVHDVKAAVETIKIMTAIEKPDTIKEDINDMKNKKI